jgi:hypothetical protein
MIVIHRMGMCPELKLDLDPHKDLPALRALAFVLNQFHHGSRFTGLCGFVGNELRQQCFELGLSTSQMVEADWEFSDAMIRVLAPHSYLTEYIWSNFPQVGIEEAAELRSSGLSTSLVASTRVRPLSARLPCPEGSTHLWRVREHERSSRVCQRKSTM